eukprot:s5016_g4.t1
MALCYRRTFIDEESPAAAVRRARSAPPAGETPVDAETVQVNKELAELSIRAQETWGMPLELKFCSKKSESQCALRLYRELLLKHSCGSTLETSQDEVSTIPSAGWSREQSEEDEVQIDGTSPSAEIAEILAPREEPEAAVAGENPGSYGHPEVCRKPCIFFQAGQQRALLRRLNATGMLTFFIPPLEKRAEEAGIQDKAAGVLDRLQEALNESSRSPTTLAADDAEYLQHLLDKMTFGNLMAMLLHNLGSSPWADAWLF